MTIEHLTTLNATAQTLAAMDVAVLEVKLLVHRVLSPAHVVLAFILRPQADYAGKTLADFSPDLEKAREEVRKMYEPRKGELAVIGYTRPLTESIQLALKIAREESGPSAKVRTDHFLRAIIEQQDPDVEQLFDTLGINHWQVQAALKQRNGVEV
ncbi:MAG: Clp protease N-terminal domain-containing protein [Candidatus Microsaccharimonas sp.]